jgi:hypothetical protein
MSYVIKYGRFFDTIAATEETKKAIDDAAETVATKLFITWNDFLSTRMRYQTGAYLSGNRVEPRGGRGSWSVHDDIAKPYGPWLEGVGSRNAPVTRFEGYHSLEDAFADVDSRIEEYVNPVIKELVEKLNRP